MKITKKIRKLNRFIPVLGSGRIIVCGIEDVDFHRQKLTEIGFTDDMLEGESVLPDSRIGLSCRKNSEGWVEVHKNQPMETFYTPVVWRWREFRGRYNYEDKEEIRYRSGKRYPRTEHPPLGIEITIRLKTDGKKVAMLEFLEVKPENYQRIVDSINVLVEIFGECDLLKDNLDAIIRGEVKRLNWRILPPGKRPWDSVKTDIKEIIEREKTGTQKVIEKRLEAINHYGPEFVAVGQHGFTGYLIFGFPQKNLFLLESIFFGNATYIFGNDWGRLSKLSKAEILKDGLQRERVIHQKSWSRDIAKILS
ncbi:MAG: hypothetical protein WC047_04530 [Kiritimatiellales bacterium]